jgi:predicted nucleic acid-binding protein
LSDPHDRPRAVLDTDIIYSRVLHELMGRAARDLRLLNLLWSEELIAETRKVLVEKKGLTDEAAQRWVGYLPRNFPNGNVWIGEALANTDFASLTSDPGDHHVCALAIASNARYLFTHDRGYLRDGLESYGVEVTTPGTFLEDAFDNAPQDVLEMLELQANDWGGGRPIEQLLDALARAGTPAFAAKVRIALKA